jgi:hypothetical protein
MSQIYIFLNIYFLFFFGGGGENVIFLWIGAAFKFHNPRTTPSSGKVKSLERGENNPVNSGNFLLPAMLKGSKRTQLGPNLPAFKFMRENLTPYLNIHEGWGTSDDHGWAETVDLSPESSKTLLEYLLFLSRIISAVPSLALAAFHTAEHEYRKLISWKILVFLTLSSQKTP